MDARAAEQWDGASGRPEGHDPQAGVFVRCGPAGRGWSRVSGKGEPEFWVMDDEGAAVAITEVGEGERPRLWEEAKCGGTLWAKVRKLERETMMESRRRR